MGDDVSVERFLSSTTIHQGRVLNLMIAKVELPNGRTHTPEVVKHPGAVALIPLLDDKLILIRQYRLPAGKILYELPAGTLSKGERPEVCAEREIVEETGFRAGKLLKIFQCYMAPGYSTEVIHFFLATELQPGTQQLDEDEEIRVFPTTLDEALTMVRENSIEDAKTTVGILLYETFLRSMKRTNL